MSSALVFLRRTEERSAFSTASSFTMLLRTEDRLAEAMVVVASQGGQEQPHRELEVREEVTEGVTVREGVAVVVVVPADVVVMELLELTPPDVVGTELLEPIAPEVSGVPEAVVSWGWVVNSDVVNSDCVVVSIGVVAGGSVVVTVAERQAPLIKTSG